jgi:hypothetical protein
VNRHCNFLGFVALAWVAGTRPWHKRCPLRRQAPNKRHRIDPGHFSGMWNHPAFPWFEPPASGPRPVTNRVRWPRVFGWAPAGTLALPPSKDEDGIKIRCLPAMFSATIAALAT